MSSENGTEMDWRTVAPTKTAGRSRKGVNGRNASFHGRDIIRTGIDRVGCSNCFGILGMEEDKTVDATWSSLGM